METNCSLTCSQFPPRWCCRQSLYWSHVIFLSTSSLSHDPPMHTTCPIDLFAFNSFTQKIFEEEYSPKYLSKSKASLRQIPKSKKYSCWLRPPKVCLLSQLDIAQLRGDGKSTVTFVREHAVKLLRWSGRVSLLTPNLGATSSYVVRFVFHLPPSLFTPEEGASYTHCIEGWMGPRTGQKGKTLAHPGNRITIPVIQHVA